MAISETGAPRRGGIGRWVGPLVLILLVAAIALDTTVIRVGSEADTREAAFDPDAFGSAEFPRIAEFVRSRAAEAPALATMLQEDREAAVAQHGTEASIGPVLATYFTGVVGEGRSGVHDVAIEGMPEDVRVRVQFGPAINGTDLRDVTGDIAFGDFTNQIEYQDAGSGINRAMAAQVFDGLDRGALVGQNVEVVGVFKLISPANWLVTPVALEVQ